MKNLAKGGYVMGRNEELAPAAMVRVILITPWDAPRALEITNSLTGFRALVGGYLEGIRLGRDLHAYVDDNGHRKQLAPNGLASQIYGRTHPTAAIKEVLGPMVLVGSLNRAGRPDGFDHDVPPGLLEGLIAAAVGLHEEKRA